MSTNPHPPTVIHNADRQRFELNLGEHVALLDYTFLDGRVGFDHTLVPDALRGRGAGSTLVRAALTEARARGWRVVPRCSFVADFLQRHPEFADVAAEASPPGETAP